ncbi:Ppx/GppA phosphatase family protein [Thermosediminibacter litoriperuensis]|uniref:Exopolyphosphatase/guanosine-5'-triphosphate, 3'-diphosphate pyrophosphatase n=1 Tax=Thermosediminibacter litoriperuensis TaxID=291989 RepID=A0A5S5AJV3_9FIRM|nr:Ppx/GppA phosphatase family protein [Thermosediminibacter litoriperuensis]TYP50876.1 exopolyphosphatase/guanosine-5'-triphosphate,3'-diphosphate pyrophosphatase [Thermosediminibacter litoriperuensis]
MKAAVIDLGSNSVRLLVAEVEGGRVMPVFKDLVTTRLGEGVAETGLLSPESMESTLTAVLEFQKAALFAGCERITAFATSAVREAGNGQEFLKSIKERVGIEVRLLSGQEEAELSFLGAREGLGLQGQALVVDIGGGSTELALGSEKVEMSVSLPMGAVRWTQRFLKSDPPQAEEITALRHEARSLLSNFKDRFGGMKSPQGVTAVGVGGTLTSLAAVSLELKEYHWSKVHGCVLGLDAMEAITGKLCRLAPLERKKIAGLAPGRADIIAAGALIALEIMKFLELGSIIVSESDLMEGILLTN